MTGGVNDLQNLPPTDQDTGLKVLEQDTDSSPLPWEFEFWGWHQEGKPVVAESPAGSPLERQPPVSGTGIPRRVSASPFPEQVISALTTLSAPRHLPPIPACSSSSVPCFIIYIDSFLIHLSTKYLCLDLFSQTVFLEKKMLHWRVGTFCMWPNVLQKISIN